MILDDLMAGIEGHQFAAEVNLAAGFDGFLHVVQNYSLIRGIVDQMRESQSVLKTVFKHLAVLAANPIQVQYENPGDSAMAAYLLAIETIDPEAALPAAEAVSLAPNCWWASRVCSRILASASLRRLGIPKIAIVGGKVRNGASVSMKRRISDVNQIADGQRGRHGSYRMRKRRTSGRAA